MARNNRSSKPRFMLSVQGRSESGVNGNEPQLTVNLLTGSDDHFVYSGTFTLSEPEWDELVRVLRSGLKGRLEIAVGPVHDHRKDRQDPARRRQNRKSAA
jgi:hypothetical protein